MKIRVPFHSFSGRLTTLMIAAATIPVLVLGTILLRQVSAMTAVSARRELQLSAEAASQSMTAALTQVRDQAVGVAADSDVRRGVKSSLFLERTDFRLSEILQKNPICAAIYLLDTTGAVVTVAPDKALPVALPPIWTTQFKAAAAAPTTSESFSLAAGEWVDELLRQAAPGRRRLWPSPELLTTLLPIPGMVGKPGGYLALLIPLERLIEVGAARVPPSASLDLVRNGASLLSAAAVTPKDQVLFAIRTPLAADELGKGIDVAVAQPAAIRFLEVRRITLEIGALITVILALLAAVSYSLAGRLLQPLQVLTAQANSYAGGDYDRVRPQLNYREFDQLAITLAGMAQFVKKHLASESARLEAEMSALRSQMSPHFLFNTLNGLATMVRVDQDQAVSMTLKLADLYRLTLDSTKAATARLDHELEVVRLYLELEAMRFGKRLSFTVATADPAWASLLLPGLILQTLVENAVKHGIATTRAGGHIDVKVLPSPEKGPWVQIRVTNSGAPYRESNGGTGVANTIRRLGLLYGEDHQFYLGTNAAGLTEVSFRCQRGRDAVSTKGEQNR